MTIKKEAELMNAIIVYCHRCHDEGDFSALTEMGFGPREMKALNSLSSADRLRLASTRTHFLNITINQEVYWRMIDYIYRENDKEALIDELVSHDAPLPMMYALTGMGSKQYSLKRRQYGLGNSPAGRPRIPTDEVADLVWTELKNIVSESTTFGPKEFLVLFNSMDKEVPLRVIWNLFYRWEKDGNLRIHRSGSEQTTNES